MLPCIKFLSIAAGPPDYKPVMKQPDTGVHRTRCILQVQRSVAQHQSKISPLLYNDPITSPGSKATIADGQYLRLVTTGTALLKSVAPF